MGDNDAEAFFFAALAFNQPVGFLSLLPLLLGGQSLRRFVHMSSRSVVFVSSSHLLDTHTARFCRIPRLGQTIIAIKAIIGSLMTPYRIR